MEPKIDLTKDLEDNHLGGYEYAPKNISLSSSGPSNVTIGGGFGAGFTYPNVTLGAGSNSISASSYPYTISGGAGTGIASPWLSNTISPKIQLNGEGADIEVNGWSLIESIKKIEQRLNILHPNDKLEAEWEELRELGNRYRELEQHIKDKQATWDKLKAVPPPVID